VELWTRKVFQKMERIWLIFSLEDFGLENVLHAVHKYVKSLQESGNSQYNKMIVQFVSYSEVGTPKKKNSSHQKPFSQKYPYIIIEPREMSIKGDIYGSTTCQTFQNTLSLLCVSKRLYPVHFFYF
jgi:hypothetical protein